MQDIDAAISTSRVTDEDRATSPWLERLELRSPDPAVCPFLRALDDKDELALPIAAPDALNRCAALREAIPQSLRQQELVCLTSPNGVRLLFEAMESAGLDARALAGVTVAAIGPGTARALAEHGVLVDVVPERFVAEGLIEALEDEEISGARVLVARAAEARDVLPDALRERGAEVDVVPLYETVREQPDDQEIEAAQSADYVTFTSSSTVTNLTEALGDRFPRGARVVSIGPITSETARAAGLEVAVEAKRHDVNGLLEALLADAGAL